MSHSAITNDMLWDTLRHVGALLQTEECWFYRGAYHFRLSPTHTLAVSPESAGRLRLETCYLTRPTGTRWARLGDRERLTSLVREARDDALVA